jgi:hypothetical protein
MSEVDEYKNETYKSLIQISLEGFKYLALINGGASVALVTYLTQAAPNARLDVTSPMACFLAGLVFCGLSFFFAYATQLALFEQAEKLDRPLPYKPTIRGAVLCSALSLFMFTAGCWLAVRVFAPAATTGFFFPVAERHAGCCHASASLTAARRTSVTRTRTTAWSPPG